MESLTHQEMIYAARALRIEASQTEREAEDPKSISSRTIFQDAAKSKRELAAKFDRMAKQMPIPVPERK